MPRRPDIFSQVSSQRDVDDEAVTELRLYAENTSELYGQKQSIIENVKRRIAGGTYDPDLAPKLWLYWVDAAAQRYCKEFACMVRRTFPLDVRTKLAEELATDYEERVRSGEFGEVVKKRRKAATNPGMSGESFDVYVDDVLRKSDLFRDEAVREVKRWLFAGNESVYAIGTRGTRLDRRGVGESEVTAGRERNRPAFASSPRRTSGSALDPSRKPSGHERGESPHRPHCLSLTTTEYEELSYAVRALADWPSEVFFEEFTPVDESLNLEHVPSSHRLRYPWPGEETFCATSAGAQKLKRAVEEEMKSPNSVWNKRSRRGSLSIIDKAWEQVLGRVP